MLLCVYIHYKLFLEMYEYHCLVRSMHAHPIATRAYIPETGRGVVAFVVPVVYITDLDMATELTPVLQIVVLLAVCFIVDTKDK